MKTCRKCGKKRSLDGFRNDRSRSDGKYPYCKKCQTKAYCVWVLTSERGAVLRRRNTCSAAAKARYHRYWLSDSRKKLHKKYKANGTLARWSNKCYRTNVNTRLSSCLRSRLGAALKRNSAIKTGSTVDLIGTTIPNLRKHLEKQFQPGMSWDNYGAWHVDHIRPCSAHNLKDVKEQRRCFHYTNLQPLWAADNIRKGDKF